MSVPAPIYVFALVVCAWTIGAAGCGATNPGGDDAGLSDDAGPDATEPQELAYELHALTDGAVRDLEVIEGEEPSFVLLVRGDRDDDDGDRVVLYDSATGEIVSRPAPSAVGEVVWSDGPRGDFALWLMSADGFSNDYWKWRRDDDSFVAVARELSAADFVVERGLNFPTGVAYGLDEEGLHRVDLREETVERIDSQHESYLVRHDPRTGRLLFTERQGEGSLWAYDAATHRQIEVDDAGSRTFGFMNSGRAVYVPESDESRVEFFDFDGASLEGWDGQLADYFTGDTSQRYLWLTRVEDSRAGYDPSAIYHDASGRVVELGAVRDYYRGVRDDARIAVYERDRSGVPGVVAHLLETDEIFPIAYQPMAGGPRFAPQHLSVAVLLDDRGWRLWSKSSGRVVNLGEAWNVTPGPYGSFWVYEVDDASHTYDKLLAGVDAFSGEMFALGPESQGVGSYCTPEIAPGGARVLFAGRGDDGATVDAMLWRQASAQTVALVEGFGIYDCPDWHVAPDVERGVLHDEQGGRLVGFDGDTPLEIDRDVEVSDIWANEDVTSVVYRARDAADQGTRRREEGAFRLKHFDFRTRQVTDIDHAPFGDPRMLDDGRVVYLVAEPGCEDDCSTALKVFWARAEGGPLLIHDDVVALGGGEDELAVRAGHIFFQTRQVDEDGEERRIRMVASPE